jgi:hypothetical protein
MDHKSPRRIGPRVFSRCHQTGRDADTALQRGMRSNAGHRSNQRQAWPHRPLGVVLVRLGISKIDEHAVSHMFRDEPAKAVHRVRHAFLISRDHLAQILLVQAGGKCRGTDEVGKHHRNLAALCCFRYGCRRCGRR